jgi:PAS domain S-box-containing protein
METTSDSRSEAIQGTSSGAPYAGHIVPAPRSEAETKAGILVVDDDPQIRKLLGKQLHAAGYECRAAEGVAEAQACLETNTFDLVLTDINMPEASGLDLIWHVNIHHPQTAVVVVSVINNPARAKAILDLGVYGYIVKPFSRNQVCITVDSALRRLQLERREKSYQRVLEKKVEKQTAELKDQLFFMHTLLDAIPSPVFYKKRDGAYLGCNTAFETFTGVDRKCIAGKTVYDMDSVALADIHHAADRKLLDAGGQRVYEATVQSAHQGLREVIVNKAVYADSNGETAGLVGVFQDITERKQMEADLRDSREKYHQIVDRVGIGVALISPEAKVMELNRQMREWFPGVTPGTAVPCYRLFGNPEQRGPCDGCPTIEAMATGEVCEGLVDSYHTGTEKRCYRIIASPIEDGDGRITAAIELVEDVTEKIALERELNQAQKLEAIGQLAAGIAHEINTPIQYVGDNTRFLQEACDDLKKVLEGYAGLVAAVAATGGHAEARAHVATLTAEVDLDFLMEEIPSALEQTMEGVQRVSKIVRAMREFSHPGTDEKQAVDLNQALESTITVASNEWKYLAEMETDFDTDLPAVPCFPGEVNQVFLNLLINAAHAISDVTDGGKSGKGRITITTRATEQSVIVTIADTGTGIPSSVQDRIFDPFFTTKAVGKGTGQGLAIAHAVMVEKHHGSLRFDTSEGCGTTFIIELPLADPAETGVADDA